MNIKVNGVNISIENGNTVMSSTFKSFEDADKSLKSIESFSDEISKQIKAVNILSNTKAVESFGYKSTEGIAQNIANGVKTIWGKIVEFIKKIINFITSFIQGGIIQIKAKMLQKKVQSAGFFVANLNTKVDWPRIEAKVVKGYVKEASGAIDTLTSANANNNAFTKVYEIAKTFASGQNTDTLTVSQVLQKLGITGVGEGTDENGVDSNTASKVNELLNTFTSGQVSYISDLKEANEVSKKALKVAQKMANSEGNADSAKATQAAVQVINHSVKMYIAYVNGTLKAIGALFAKSTTSKPGTPEFDAFVEKASAEAGGAQ